MSEPTQSPMQLSAGLDGLRGHVERADGWAQDHLQRFPRLASVSIELGVAFGLQFTVMLTWQRGQGMRVSTEDLPCVPSKD